MMQQVLQKSLICACAITRYYTVSSWQPSLTNLEWAQYLCPDTRGNHPWPTLIGLKLTGPIAVIL